MATAAPGVDVDALLLPLSTGPSAMIPATELAGLWHLEPEASLDVCADLEADGWVCSWDAPDGIPRVILTSLAAERLEVELHPTGADAWDCVWRPIAASWRGERHEYRRDEATLETDLTEPDTGRHGVLDSIADPRSERGAEFDLILVGLRPPWPGPSIFTAVVCLGCRSRTLPEHGVCLVCAKHGSSVRVGAKDPRLLANRAKKQYQPDAKHCGGRGKAVGKKVATPKKTVGYRASRPRRNSFDLKVLGARVGV